MQPIQDVRKTAGAVYLTLRDGSMARLDCSHPNFDSLMIYVESDLRRRRPVGIIMDAAGRVLDLGAAHDTPVRSVGEFPNDPNRFQVSFWAYSPVCGLLRDQPDFDRIHETLRNAVRSGQMVWVVTHSQEVVEGEPDDDGLIPAYPKNMDVRPVLGTEGLETLPVNPSSDNTLRHPAFQGGAKSGAVADGGAAPTIETLAAALMNLSPADRARLAAMLLGQQPGGSEGKGEQPE
jgi:hypothetical protein